MPSRARSGTRRSRSFSDINANGSEHYSPALLGGLVASLSREERLLLCLRYADGLQDDEIAVLTRMAVCEVRQAMERVVARARQLVTLAADPA